MSEQDKEELAAALFVVLSRVDCDVSCLPSTNVLTERVLAVLEEQ